MFYIFHTIQDRSRIQVNKIQKDSGTNIKEVTLKITESQLPIIIST